MPENVGDVELGRRCGSLLGLNRKCRSRAQSRFMYEHGIRGRGLEAGDRTEGRASRRATLREIQATWKVGRRAGGGDFQ